MNESDDEILPEARVFEYRARNILQSKIEAIKELMNKAPNELEELEEEEDTKTAKKPRGRKPKKEKSEEAEKKVRPKRTKKKITAVEDDVEDIASERNRRDGTPTLESDEDSPPKRNRRGGTPDDDWYDSPPKKTKGGRKKKMPVDIDLENVNSEDLISYMNLPAASKRKIKELKLNSSRLQKRINMENNRILSACDVAEEAKESPEDVDSEQSIILKIRLLSDVSKITVKLREMFASIYEKVADMLNLQASEILLCVRDQTIKLTDTPLSLNLKYFEIIDCIPYKPSDDKRKDSSKKFLLKMQSNDSRKKVDVFGSKFEKFEHFMKQYSEMRNIPIEKLSFEFDGEKIQGFETPEELDIESGSCIDVNVEEENPKPTTLVNSEIEITAEIISQKNRIDILEVD